MKKTTGRAYEHVTAALLRPNLCWELRLGVGSRSGVVLRAQELQGRSVRQSGAGRREGEEKAAEQGLCTGRERALSRRRRLSGRCTRQRQELTEGRLVSAEPICAS